MLFLSNSVPQKSHPCLHSLSRIHPVNVVFVWVIGAAKQPLFVSYIDFNVETFSGKHFNSQKI